MFLIDHMMTDELSIKFSITAHLLLTNGLVFPRRMGMLVDIETIRIISHDLVFQMICTLLRSET
jgi:hypothetical protein